MNRKAAYRYCKLANLVNDRWTRDETKEYRC